MSQRNLDSTYPKIGLPLQPNRQDSLSVPQPTHGGGTGRDSRHDASSGGHPGQKLDKTLSHVKTGHDSSCFGPNNTLTTPNTGHNR